MGPLNNREIATGIWILVLAFWLLKTPAVRNSLSSLLRTLFQPKILTPIGLMLVYVLGVTAALAVLRFWQFNLLKDTLVWFCFGALAMFVRFGTANRAGKIFREVALDNVKLIILLEFMVNTYTFPLSIELLLVPLLTIIAMLDVVASSKAEFAQVAKLIKGAQAIFGLAIIAVATAGAVSDWRNLGSLDTMRSVAIVPVLSLSLLPFMYFLCVYSKYDLVFLRLRLGPDKSSKLKRYARRHIIGYAGLRLKRLDQLLSDHALDLMHIRTHADVDSLLWKATQSATFCSGQEEQEVGAER